MKSVSEYVGVRPPISGRGVFPLGKIHGNTEGQKRQKRRTGRSSSTSNKGLESKSIRKRRNYVEGSKTDHSIKTEGQRLEKRNHGLNEEGKTPSNGALDA